MRTLFITDPLHLLNIAGDTGLALMERAHLRGHEVFNAQTTGLYAKGDAPLAIARPLAVDSTQADPIRVVGEAQTLDLRQCDVVFMRRDPPFDMDYIFATYILSLAAKETIIVNDPEGLRSCNEKTYILQFPELIPETLVTKDIDRLKAFVQERGKAVVKPLDGKGGEGILFIERGSLNTNSILELLSQGGQRYIMIQDYVPASRDGDKRILLINGEPIGAFLRVPAADDLRGNMCAGAHVEAAQLNARDLAICKEIAPQLRADGHMLAGIDILGDYLSEINVTSPTGARELVRLGGPDISEVLFDKLEEAIATHEYK